MKPAIEEVCHLASIQVRLFDYYITEGFLHGWYNPATTADAVCSWWWAFRTAIFRRIPWTARTLHEASVAISLVLNPSFSKVLIKIRRAAFSCGIMITDTKALTMAGEEEEGRIDGAGWWGASGLCSGTIEVQPGRSAQPGASGNGPPLK